MWVYLLAGGLIVGFACALIYDVLHPSYHFPITVERTREEIQIERSGSINALQRYRYQAYRKTKSPSSTLISDTLVIEEDLRWFIQLEADQEGYRQHAIETHKEIYMLMMHDWKY